MWVGYFGFGISSSGAVGFGFVWLVVCFGFNGWLVVLDSGFCGFSGCVSFMGFDYDVGCVGFGFWGFWVLRSFFGVYGLWVMRCWFGCGWCSMDAGGSVLDFNFWVCVLRFGFVFFFNTHLISIHVIFSF